MNPLDSTTADEVLAELADPLDALLRQVINGFFVLTDGQGSVSKWSEPAELLFAQPSEEILGQGFFETLIGGALSPEAQAWRGFLDAGESPRVPGSVTVTGRRSDGETFPLEAVFVPVKLDEGFDFSLFLEDLSFELPLNLMLLRMRQQHPVVVRALKTGVGARSRSRGRDAPPARWSSSSRWPRRRGWRPSWRAAKLSARWRTPRPRSG